MKINGPGAVGPTATPRRARKTADTGEKFAEHLTEDGTSVASVGISSPLAAVDALLALQEVPDATKGRSRAFERAENLLAGLDDIRQGLLTGAVPQEKLSLLGSVDY